MARYRNDYDDREYRGRNDRFERERPWNYNEPLPNQGRSFDERRDFAQGRFGERADYQHDEPRYTDQQRRYGQEDYRRSSYEGRDPQWSNSSYDRSSRSRLRVRDIMTRDLAVASRDTTLREVAAMMRDEDTGVIPVIDYAAGDATAAKPADERRRGNGYGYGKLVGLITDRDIAIRAVADGKDCNATRAEEIMSTDVHTSRPHDRVVDVTRKMGDKQVRRIPVVNEGGRLLGMVSIGDIAVETEADRELAEALEDISKESSFWNKVFG